MTFDLYLIIALAFVALLASLVCYSRFTHEYIVSEGTCGLLYHNGELVETLASGRHIRTGRNYELVRLDARKSLLAVVGQEVLSSDNIALKLSVVFTTQIVDAQKYVSAADNAFAHLYNGAQAAIRLAVAGHTMEEMLAQRNVIGAQLIEVAESVAQEVGVTVHSVVVRDLMLPGDLRKAFSDVLKARQEGNAALERARGESAALRNLANAARLIENQPALATLRFLQTLENSRSTQTVLMNDLGGLVSSLSARSHPTDQS